MSSIKLKVVGINLILARADRRNGSDISFKRVGGKYNSPTRYPLHEVSKFINNTEKVL